MRLTLTKHRSKLATICAGIIMLAMVFGAAILPRTKYYLERASFHLALKSSHTAKAQTYRKQIDETARIDSIRKPSGIDDFDDYLSDLIEDEEKSASRHAQLSHRYRRAAWRFWERPPGNLPLP